ncbi:hypothetical protein Patl1_11894 [Pistacia atlantica]|uniref:Uncharacterized protein n=1 Tax=Pistacia atlantica TaxID=434234 RepID=A0ACC1AA44_9ROSI|nr:hypothetical protein Patl1_11894 [Pistacia atlantica]
MYEEEQARLLHTQIFLSQILSVLPNLLETGRLKLCSALGCDSDNLSELYFFILFSKTKNQKLMAAALAPYPKPHSGAGFSKRSSELLPFVRTRTNSAASVALQVPSKKLHLVTASATHSALPLSHSCCRLHCLKLKVQSFLHFLWVKRHTISVFVGDESGIINRIAGVFARRGYNTESLAVGLNEDKALFTIVVSGTERVLRQVVEQLNKLVNVIKIMWLVDIFRAKVVDTSEHSLTIEVTSLRFLYWLYASSQFLSDCKNQVTGDPGKVVAVQRNLRKFGIKELARIGKV